jgi:hypothetical protein
MPFDATEWDLSAGGSPAYRRIVTFLRYDPGLIRRREMIRILRSTLQAHDIGRPLVTMGGRDIVNFFSAAHRAHEAR